MEGNALVFEKIFFKRRKNRLFAFADTAFDITFGRL